MTPLVRPCVNSVLGCRGFTLDALCPDCQKRIDEYQTVPDLDYLAVRGVEYEIVATGKLNESRSVWVGSHTARTLAVPVICVQRKEN